MPRDKIDSSEELSQALAHLAEKGRELAIHFIQINDPKSIGEFTTSYRNSDRTCLAVSESDDDELRDNLFGLYSSIQRPPLRPDNFTFSTLMIDKLINDIRDVIVKCDQLAKEAGLIVTGQELLLPQPVLIQPVEYGSDLADIKANLASMTGDIATLKVTGNQIGLINISVPKIELKVELARAISGLKVNLDISSLTRLLKGAVRLGEKLVDSVRGTSVAITHSIITVLIHLTEEAKKAFKVSQRVLEDQTNGDLSSEFDSDRIWTESEVLKLLKDGTPIPRDAVPYVKSLDLSYGLKFSMSELAKLTALNSLSFYVEGNKSLATLSSLCRLQNLSVHLTRGGVDCTFLTKMKNLKTLTISGPYAAKSKSVMPLYLTMPFLEKINLKGIELSSLPDFSECIALKDIELEASRIKDWQNISTATKVERLDLSSSNFHNTSYLLPLSELRALDIRNIGVSNYSVMGRLPKLETIHMSRRLANPSNMRQIPTRIEIRGDYNGFIRYRQ